MSRLKQLSLGHLFFFAFAATYTAYGLWFFVTKPAIPDHAVIVGGLICYAGLSVIALSVVWRAVRRVLKSHRETRPA